MDASEAKMRHRVWTRPRSKNDAMRMDALLAKIADPVWMLQWQKQDIVYGCQTAKIEHPVWMPYQQKQSILYGCFYFSSATCSSKTHRAMRCWVGRRAERGKIITPCVNTPLLLNLPDCPISHLSPKIRTASRSVFRRGEWKTTLSPICIFASFRFR